MLIEACMRLLDGGICSIASPDRAMKLHLSTAAERSSVRQEGAENHVQGRGGKTAQAHGYTSVICCPLGVTCANTVDRKTFLHRRFYTCKITAHFTEVSIHFIAYLAAV